MNLYLFRFFLICCFFHLSLAYSQNSQPKTTPMMGWSSWNNFHININEKLIKEQTDALISFGLKAAGYEFINIDDGYYGGRDVNGNMTFHPTKFPNGLKNLVSYIHGKDLKAGTYTDAGINTCASYWDKDTVGVGMGLYGHERQDLQVLLKDCDFDFIKVDWCGGEWLNMNEELRYTQIGNIIKEIKPTTLYNICRWQFPGSWVGNVAYSWRISGDIGNNFASVMKIIDQNANLWKYASPGHLNDMDMLQVGRGMTYEEDKTHFSMWCMLNSPLLAGNDLTKMSKQTIDILTNKDIIAINQDPLVYQARRLRDDGEQELWARPLISTMSGQIAVALLNRSNAEKDISFDLETVGLDASKAYTMKDVWSKKEFAKSVNANQTFKVPAHGVVVLKIQGTSKPFNIYQFENMPK